MNESRTLILDVNGHVDQHSPFLVFRLSWLAYVREILALLVRLLVCCGVASLAALGLERFAGIQTMTWLPALGFVAAIAWTVYSIALTSTVRLFTDDNGVWVQSGLFPWERGVSGVQWRDLGQAGYTMGFMSWAVGSYDVRISHRFTAGAEVHLRNVHRGNLAVEHINAIMSQLQGRVVPAY